MKISLVIGAIIMVAAAALAKADLVVKFIEGAPKDRFVFINAGACPIIDASILLDLSPAPSGLIFDTEDKGPGIEVFQPLEMIKGADTLNSTPTVKDVVMLEPGKTIAFTIDVDDTTSKRGITVTGSEIAGAQVTLKKSQSSASSKFSKLAQAIIELNDC